MSGFRLGLVLGSGSARGLAHIGVLKVLDRERLPIDMIAGTSIGALIGGAYAVGVTPEEMEVIALSADVRRLVSLVDIARPTTALVKGRKVEAFIREIVDGKTFAETRIPFACVAVDVANEQEVVLRDGDLAKAIRASLSTPIVFAPVELDGRMLVDGAVLNPVPVDVARDMGADVVIAITNRGIPSSRLPAYCNDKDEESIEVEKGNTWGLTEVYSKAVALVMDRVKSPSVYQLAAGLVGLMQRGLSEPRLKAADLVIAPQIDEVAYYSFNEAERIITLGEKAAEMAVMEIRALMATTQAAQTGPQRN